MTNEEFEREIKRLEERIEDQINSLRIKFLESKADKKPYEVEVPDDIDDYYYTDEYGKVNYLEGYNSSYEKNKYIRGLVFKTEEEAEHYDKERQLIQKMKDWGIEHREGLKGRYFPRWYIKYDYQEECFVYMFLAYEQFSILPCFISRDLAEQFIEEFGDEIKEVLC